MILSTEPRQPDDVLRSLEKALVRPGKISFGDLPYLLSCERLAPEKK